MILRMSNLIYKYKKQIMKIFLQSYKMIKQIIQFFNFKKSDTILKFIKTSKTTEFNQQEKDKIVAFKIDTIKSQKI